MGVVVVVLGWFPVFVRVSLTSKGGEFRGGQVSNSLLEKYSFIKVVGLNAFLVELVKSFVVGLQVFRWKKVILISWHFDDSGLCLVIHKVVVEVIFQGSGNNSVLLTIFWKDHRFSYLIPYHFPHLLYWWMLIYFVLWLKDCPRNEVLPSTSNHEGQGVGQHAGILN